MGRKRAASCRSVSVVTSSAGRFGREVLKGWEVLLSSRFAVILAESPNELISCIHLLFSLRADSGSSLQATPAPPLSSPPVRIISAKRVKQEHRSKPGCKCVPHITQEGFVLMHFAPFSSLYASAASDLSDPQTS